MKYIKTVLAGALLLAMTAHAQADFIITPIAFALFAGPLGGALSFAAIYTGLQVAAFAAVVGAQLAIAGSRKQKIDPGEMKNTFQETETSEFNAVGRVKLGGLKAFGNTRGSTIYRLIWHVKGPMVAIEEYFLGGYEVTVDADGRVSSPPWVSPSSSYAYVTSKVGDGTETAWSQLIAEFPALWTANHRCRGIFQSLVQFVVPALDTEWGNKKFQKLYQGGAPDLEVVARIGVIYDPRNPSHSPDDSSTWTWADNGILCAVHIMRHYSDLTSSDFDWPFIAAEANRADALVATKNGTERRARCWGIWPSESRRGDVMQQVLDSIGAEVVLSDSGLIRIRFIDDAPTSEITFTEKHITELDWKSGPEAVERPNICRIKYYSPERGYDMGEIDMTGIAWARVQSEVDRYGEKIFDVELPFCPSPSQAQRIARRMFLLARGDAGAVRTNMAGLAAWGVTYAAIHDGEDEMLCHISPPRIDDEAGQVDIPFVVWPAELIDAPWSPATMEADAPIQAPIMQQESALPTPAAPLEACQIVYPDASREVRIRFAGVTGGTIAEATRRNYSGANPNPWASMTEYLGHGGSNWYAYAGVDWEGDDADFRVRFFNAAEEGSYWSPHLEARPLVVNNAAPSVPTNVHHDPQSGGNGAVIHATAPDVLRVAYLRFQASGGGAPPDWPVDEMLPCRPGDELSVELPVVVVGPWPDSATVNYSITACTSDGTPSAAVTGSYTITGTPPGGS